MQVGDCSLNIVRQSARLSAIAVTQRGPVADKNKTQIIRAGSRTYFLDVCQTKDGKDYLVITESRFMGEGKERERQRVIGRAARGDGVEVSVVAVALRQ